MTIIDGSDKGDDKPVDYERAPVIVDPSKPEEAPKAARRLRAFKKWCGRHITPMNILTLVIAGAACAQYVATHGQLETMNSQLREMRDNSLEATDKTNRVIANINWLSSEMYHSVQQSRSLIETNKQQSQAALSATINQMRLDQRAWLGPLSFDTPQIAAGEKLRFGIVSSNSGKTPALHVRSEITFTYWYKGDALNLDSRVTKIDHQSVSAVMPGSQGHIYTNESDDPIDSKAIDLLRTGDPKIVIFGQIKYSDIFEAAHFTKFCFVLQKDLKTGGACETYNEAN